MAPEVARVGVGEVNSYRFCTRLLSVPSKCSQSPIIEEIWTDVFRDFVLTVSAC
jgi:hypothetical protein